MRFSFCLNWHSYTLQNDSFRQHCKGKQKRTHKMAIYSRPSIQNFDNWRLWIRKNKHIAYLIKEQDHIEKIFLYAKDLSEPKYEFLIKKCKKIKHLNEPNTFIECSNTMNAVYENIDDCNPSRKRKNLVVFDDMIAGIMTNNKFQTIIK